MLRIRPLFLGLLGVLVAEGFRVPAQEADPPRGDQPPMAGARPDARQPEARAGGDLPPGLDKNVAKRLREVMAKRRAGEELTADERALMDRAGDFLRRMGQGNLLQGGQEVRGGFMPGGGGGPMAVRWNAPGMPQDPMTQLLTECNVVDRALLTSAQQWIQAEKPAQAGSVLEKVATQSPDPDAAGAARYMQAKLLLDKGEKEAALKKFRQVTGKAAPLALSLLLGPLSRNGEVTALKQACMDLLAAQPTALDRARVLRTFCEWLQGPESEGLAAETKAEVLAQVSEKVTYKEALETREALAKESAAASARGPMPFAMPLGGGNNFGPGFGPPQPPGAENANREADLRRKLAKEAERGARDAGQVAREGERLREEAKRLEADGRKEEAGKLRQKIEKLGQTQPAEKVQADF